jgi:hypothetical protein
MQDKIRPGHQRQKGKRSKNPSGEFKYRIPSSTEKKSSEKQKNHSYGNSPKFPVVWVSVHVSLPIFSHRASADDGFFTPPGDVRTCQGWALGLAASSASGLEKADWAAGAAVAPRENQ